MENKEWGGTVSFGYWLQRRRKTLDLTRNELAGRVGCSPVTIKKIERDERRPSRQIAGLLADHLAVPDDERERFIGMARGEYVPAMASPLEIDAVSALNLPRFDADSDGLDGPFVGRKNQLSKLTYTLDQARFGSGKIEFVIGGAGRGKTTLVKEFAQRASEADPTLLVTSAYCNAHTGLSDPYLPFREVLSLLTGDVASGWAGGLIPQAQSRRLWEAATTTIPTLVEHGPDLIGSLVSASELLSRASTLVEKDVSWYRQLETIAARKVQSGLERQRIFSQFLSVLKAIARHRTILILLEDLHWIDASSSALLFYLSRQIKDIAVFILGTYRPEEINLEYLFAESAKRHPMADILSELKRRHGDIWLDLGKDDPIEGREFVDGYLDSEPNRLSSSFRDELFQHTAGHALFTTELLKEMQERGDLYKDAEGYWVKGQELEWENLPVKVEGAIERRIGRLPDELKSIVTAASIEGETFTAEVTARVLHLDEWEFAKMLSRDLDKRHRLVKAQAIEMIGSQRLSYYRFRHHLFQHYIYHQLDEMERAYLHEQVGRVIEQAYEERLEIVAIPLARHFQEAGLISEAIKYLDRAADRAHKLFALDEAIQLSTRAINLARKHPNSCDEPTLLRLVNLRGEAHSLAGHFEQASTDLYLILQAAQEADDMYRERAVLMRMGLLFRRADNPEKALNFLDQALVISRSLNDQRAEADCLYHLGTLYWDSGNNHRALNCHQEAVGICRQLGLTDLVAVQAIHGLAETNFMAGEANAAVELFSESLSLSVELGDKSYEAENLHMIGWASAGTLGTGDYRIAQDHQNQALAITRSTGMTWHHAFSLQGLGYVLGCLGDYEQGLVLIRQSYSLSESIGITRLRTMSLELHAELLMDLNLLDEAAQFLNLGVELSLRENSAFWLPRLKTRLAVCRLREGRHDVEPDLLEALEIARENGQGLHAAQSLEGLAELYLAQEDFEASSACAEELRDFAEKNGMREMVARALRWRGEALFVQGLDQEAEEQLILAAELASVIGRVRLQWDVNRVLNQLYGRQGKEQLAQKHEDAMMSILRGINENLQQIEMRRGLPI